MGEVTFAIVQTLISAGAGYCAATAVGPFLVQLVPEGLSAGKTAVRFLGALAIKGAIAGAAAKSVSESLSGAWQLRNVIKPKKKEKEED